MSNQSKLKWWIKERHNPQIGVYYVGLGQLSEKEAKRYKCNAYGTNTLLSFESEEEYLAKLQQLSKNNK
jgi:hypothetical protein